MFPYLSNLAIAQPTVKKSDSFVGKLYIVYQIKSNLSQ